MPKDYAAQVLAWASGEQVRPLKIKALARRLAINELEYPEFRDTVKAMVRSGQLELGRDRSLSLAAAGAATGTGTGPSLLQGTYKRSSRGFGFVRPSGSTERASDIFIPPNDGMDAWTGDVVEVRIAKRGKHAGAKNREGRIVRIVSRAAGAFVGHYLEHRGRGYVKVDGTKFDHPIAVGDPGAKGVRPGDKVVLEITRYPSGDRGGQGVIAEVLGSRGQPGVDTIAVIRAFGLPEAFDEAVLADAREQALKFNDDDLSGRRNLLDVLTVTIDPVDARDFDDAISLSRDDRGFWTLMVHVADVSWFVTPNSPMDAAARKRGNSVYLPDKVLPMLPEALSNRLASLQENETRFAVTAILEFSPEGIVTNTSFARTAIRVDQRFTYERAMAVMANPDDPADDAAPEVRALLARMSALAMILRKRRFQRGALELTMPEVKIELDEHGAVKSAKLAAHDQSHQVIEEFMLAANEAVAGFLAERGVDFPRRAHDNPEPAKLRKFAEFARGLGVAIRDPESRFELQRALDETAGLPIRHAIHFGLLRSLKQAVYTAERAPHYALASENYCHFTSPIRRYPDLLAHRQLLAILEGKRPRETAESIAFAAEQCNKTERRAEAAERELIRVKLLTFLQSKIGEEFHGVIIGVEDFGFFCQLEEWPVEGLIRLGRLGEGVYDYDDVTHSLIARSGGRRFRLGDRVLVRIQHIDVDRRELDLRWISSVAADRDAERPDSRERIKGGGRNVEAEAEAEAKRKDQGKGKPKGKPRPQSKRRRPPTRKKRGR